MQPNIKISWCATMSKEDSCKDVINKTNIKNQTITPFEVIITTQGNIAQGRNEYLQKAKGEYIASFDAGCLYPSGYSELMINRLKEENADIVIASVKPMITKNPTLIQEFCALRLPQYNRFDNEDWSKFIPSNRQVIFKKEIIDKLGLIPEYLYRSDDTYWFRKARLLGLKFAYCEEAVVYWEMKTSLKSYLKTVYQDNKCDKKFKIKGFQSPQKISPKIFPYGLFVGFLAMITKFWAKVF